MQIELLKNAKGIFELWADNSFVREILRHKGENDTAYNSRVEAEYDAYVAAMRRIQNKGPQKVKTTTI